MSRGSEKLTSRTSICTPRARWADTIRAAWLKSVQGIIDTGKALTEAKHALPHGEWLLMVSEDLPFKERAAQRLMAIAADNWISKASHGTYLPASWRTLAEMTRLDDGQKQGLVEHAQETGHPVERRDVEAVLGAPHVAHNSGENEWYTPAAIIEAARKAMGGIDLDPASSAKAQETVQAGTYFTIEDNGLAQEWTGRVWMNPPYSKELIGLFVEKLVQSKGVMQACVLVNNATETRWGQSLIRESDAVCFLSSRVRFLTPKGLGGAPLQGQMLFYFGDRAAHFSETLSQLGEVLLIDNRKDPRTSQPEGFSVSYPATTGRRRHMEDKSSARKVYHIEHHAVRTRESHRTK